MPGLGVGIGVGFGSRRRAAATVETPAVVYVGVPTTIRVVAPVAATAVSVTADGVPIGSATRVGTTSTWLLTWTPTTAGAAVVLRAAPNVGAPASATIEVWGPTAAKALAIDWLEGDSGMASDAATWTNQGTLGGSWSAASEARGLAGKLNRRTARLSGATPLEFTALKTGRSSAHYRAIHFFALSLAVAGGNTGYIYDSFAEQVTKDGLSIYLNADRSLRIRIGNHSGALIADRTTPVTPLAHYWGRAQLLEVRLTLTTCEVLVDGIAVDSWALTGTPSSVGGVYAENPSLCSRYGATSRLNAGTIGAYVCIPEAGGDYADRARLRGYLRAKWAPPAVWVLGDSTAESYVATTHGWAGKILERFAQHATQIIESTDSGDSSKSHWDVDWTTEAAFFQGGDMALMQWGHNDEQSGDPARYTTTGTAPSWTGTFRDYLTRFTDDFAAKGGVGTVLITPVERMTWSAGVLVDSHRTPSAPGNYADSQLVIAADEGVASADLNTRSRAEMTSAGETYVAANWAYSGADRTHFSEAGAVRVASWIADLCAVSAPITIASLLSDLRDSSLVSPLLEDWSQSALTSVARDGAEYTAVNSTANNRHALYTTLGGEVETDAFTIDAELKTSAAGMRLYVATASWADYAIVNASTGAVLSQSANCTGVTVTDAGGGWWRIRATFSAAAAATYAVIGVTNSDTSLASFVGASEVWLARRARAYQ